MNKPEAIPTPPADYVPQLCNCWTCQGRGKVRAPKQYGTFVPCRTCAGTGKTEGKQRRESK